MCVCLLSTNVVFNLVFLTEILFSNAIGSVIARFDSTDKDSNFVLRVLRETSGHITDETFSTEETWFEGEKNSIYANQNFFTQFSCLFQLQM